MMMEMIKLLLKAINIVLVDVENVAVHTKNSDSVDHNIMKAGYNYKNYVEDHNTFLDDYYKNLIRYCPNSN